MRMEASTVAAVFAAGAASTILTFVVLQAALGRKILIDSPNERSSHERPKPRGGGVGVIGGLVLGASIGLGAHPLSRAALFLLLGVLMCAAVGL